MAYLDGRGFNPITTFGKVSEGNFDFKQKYGAVAPSGWTVNNWVNKSTLPVPKLRFGLTHPDTRVSQVREKPIQGFTLRMNNLTKMCNIPCPELPGITTYGTPNASGPQFPNHPGQFHIQSPQVQTRNGSTWGQQKKDGKL